MELFFRNVLLEPVEKPKTTAGGLHLPDVEYDLHDEVAGRYRVVAVGVDCRNMDAGSVGATVAIRKYAGSAIEIGGKKMKVVSEKEILGVFEQ